MFLKVNSVLLKQCLSKFFGSNAVGVSSFVCLHGHSDLTLV